MSNTIVAAANRKPANVNGGRKSRPILIPSQVEPQIRHKAANTIAGPFDAIVAILIGYGKSDQSALSVASSFQLNQALIRSSRKRCFSRNPSALGGVDSHVGFGSA